MFFAERLIKGLLLRRWNMCSSPLAMGLAAQPAPPLLWRLRLMGGVTMGLLRLGVRGGESEGVGEGRMGLLRPTTRPSDLYSDL